MKVTGSFEPHEYGWTGWIDDIPVLRVQGVTLAQTRDKLRAIIHNTLASQQKKISSRKRSPRRRRGTRYLPTLWSRKGALHI